MKLRILLMVAVLMIFWMPIFGQVAPEYPSAILVGPVSVDGELALHIGYSKNVFGIWVTGFGRFGETVEAMGEITKLFKISKRLYFGPVAGGGVDWSDRIGTAGLPVEAYVFGSAGAGITLGFTDKIGSWGFWKSRTEKKPIFGLGLYLLL